MKIVFRADASLQMGTGHVMRCLTLADALAANGAECQFICRAHSGHLADFIRQKGYRVHLLDVVAEIPEQDAPLAHAAWLGVTLEQDAKETAALLSNLQSDWLIVDHYALDARWETQQRRHVRKLMVIDDLADRQHDCDLLLDQNFGRTATDYIQIVPAQCHIIVGSEHVLLRPQFAAKREASFVRRINNEIRHILIQMGGADQCKATCEVLSALQRCALPTDARISVVLNGDPHEIKIVQQQALKIKCPVTLRIGVKDMAQLMADSDLAIGSGGGATYERIYMGLPSILRAVAENQISPLYKMRDAGLFEIFEDINDLTRKISHALFEGVCKPCTVVNDGTSGLADELLKTRVALRTPCPFDIRRSFRWLQNNELRTYFLMQSTPELKSHFQYWKAILKNPKQHVFSIYLNNIHIGNAGIKNISHDNGEAELWLYLGGSDTRGKGIGKIVLAELERIIRFNIGMKRAVLHVGKNNAAANHLYRQAGYKPATPNLFNRSEFNDRKVIKMERHL